MTATESALDPATDLVAYLCAEYCVDDRLPIYAGGLGVLAGDHLKTASDLGTPLVAVGLLYREGYFRQTLDGAGQQHAAPDLLDPLRLGLKPVASPLGRELRVQVPLADHAVSLRIWRVMVGHIPLFLLDADCPENRAEDRRITARLYGGGHEARLQQEIVLGVGAVRALRALGLSPTVWHLNEGHAAFAILERARELVTTGLSFGAALEIVAAETVFTTHTPVPAGHDVFDHGLLRHWLGDWFGSLHTTERRLFELGADAGGPHRFSMTALALRGSRFRNAVSDIHRDVAAQMESYAWPNVPPAESPLRGIVNGVHLPSFMAPEWSAQWQQRFPEWRSRRLSQEDCAWIGALTDAEVEAVRRPARLRLAEELRRRLTEQNRRNGVPADVAAQTLAGLDQIQNGALLLGFARRFATYKRATLLLSDIERLERLLNQQDQPTLLVFAGKAHPHDVPGQGLIRQLHEAAQREGLRGRLLVVEGYDAAFARALVGGCDAWLNTPEYPLEASGTSGMKSAANGGLNVSVLDGWWAEGYDGENGWAIVPRTDLDGHGRYHDEARQLFELLEQRVLPEYFSDRPRHLARSRAAMQTLIPRFGGARMVGDYVRLCYAPAAAHGRRLRAHQCREAIAFKRWKRMVQAQAGGVTLAVVGRAPLTVHVGLNGLSGVDLNVEHAAGGTVRTLLFDREHGQRAEYVLKGDAPPGELRVVPAHSLLPHRYELGIVARLALE